MTLFDIHDACVILSAVGALAAVLVVIGLWRIAAAEVRRRGIAKTLLFVVLSAPVAFWAGGKGGRENVKSKDVDSNNQTIQAIKQSNNRLSSLHRYFAPTNFAAGADVFMRPTNAVTPSMWTRHNVSDDFQVAAPGWVAGICGVVTTQPWGIDSPETIEDGHTTLAPLYATNSFLLGTSDFWAVTNESSKTFVWKDLAFNRDPSNLVSFAATIYDWGDVEFTYGNIPEDGFSSFVKIGSETQDMTPFVAEGQAVRLEKNHEQDAEWWRENYPEICHTNEIGELVFEYDTNEWCFVQIVIESLEEYEAYEKAIENYERIYDSLSNDLFRIVKYTVHVMDAWPDDDEFEQSVESTDGIDLMKMLRAKYGEKMDLEGWAIDELPSGLPPDDVIFAGVENGSITNIMKWHIEDDSKIIEKIGRMPEPEMFDGDSLTDIPFAARGGVSGGIVVDLRISFKVPANTTVKVDRMEENVYSWGCMDKKSDVITIPCRSGFVYHAYANRAFQDFRIRGLSNSVSLEHSDNTSYAYFHRKLSLSVDGVAFTNASFATARAIMTPPVRNGGYSWESSDNINVVPIANSNRAGVFLENGDAGFVKCVWDNGESGKWNLCATGEVSVVANNDYTNLTQFVEFGAAPRVLVYEDAHLGTDGIWVPATSNLASTLSCAYNGNRAGTLELSKISGPDVLVSENGAAVTLPYSWEVSGGGNDAVRSFTVRGLSPGNAAEFRLRFTSNAAPGGIDYYATVRAVALEVVAQRTLPEERHRRVFGPREIALLSIEGGEDEVAWRSPAGVQTGSSLRAEMPEPPMDLTAEVVIDGYSYSFPISVIGPSACVGTNAVAMTDADWLEVTTNALAVGEVGAGLRIDLKLMPDYVSFFGLKTMEGFAPASDMQGYFTQVGMSSVNHDAQNGAGRVNVVQEGNVAGVDRAGTAYRVDELPQPWSGGSYAFNIPYYWWVDGSSQTNQFTTNVQTFRLFANGDAEVSKFGWTAHRGTNGVQTVAREAQP